MTDNFTFDHIIQHLLAGDNLSYARYGDGEWRAILGRPGKNCDGHIYFPDMGEELWEILASEPEYYLGLQRLAKELFQSEPDFISLVDRNNWVDNEVFTTASKQGILLDALKPVLASRHVIQVGNASLRPLNLADVFVEIPERNCWLQRERIMGEIWDAMKEDAMVLYSAGMPTKWFINTVYNIVPGMVSQLDCGSVFDYYVGRDTRNYMKMMRNEEA